MRWKGLTHDWITFAGMDDGTLLPSTMACLTELEASIIVAALTPLSWETRWENLPEGKIDEIQALIADIQAKIMCNNGCCETVAYCIRNDAGVQAALNEWAKGEGWGQPAERDFPIAPTDLDCLWGGISAMVTFMRADFETILDAIDSAASAVEAAGDWMKLFPAPQARAVSEVFAIVAPIGTATIKATLTQGTLDGMKCDLFCMVQAATNYAPPYKLTLELFLEWLQVYADDTNPLEIGRRSLALCYVGVTLGLGIQTFAVLSRRAAIQRYTLNIDNCNDDWNGICDDCEIPYCAAWLGENSVNGFTVNSGAFIQDGAVSRVDGNTIDLSWQSSQSFNVSSMVFTFAGIGSSNANCEVFVQQVAGGAWVSIETDSRDNGEWDVSVNQDVYGFRLLATRSFSFELTDVSIEGTNRVPLELFGSDCL